MLTAAAAFPTELTGAPVISSAPPLVPPSKLTLRTNGPRAWMLRDASTGADVGGIDYQHAQDGNHYRPWLFIDGVRHDVGDCAPQLAIAARAVADAATRLSVR